MASPLIFIDGDQGTTGLQIHQRLRDRTDLRLITLSPEHRKDPQRRAEIINACDIAILCLPDQAARDAVASIENPAVRVIDASSAHRTHPDWTYGFAEMNSQQAQRIATARRVSNPGCYPTGAIGLLRPLLEAGLLPRDYPTNIHAVSGYSGKGRVGVQEHEGEGASQAPAFQVYGLGLAHKHIPEIQQQSGLMERPMFVPAYGAFRQGIVLTIPLQLRFSALRQVQVAIHSINERELLSSGSQRSNLKINSVVGRYSHVHLTPIISLRRPIPGRRTRPRKREEQRVNGRSLGIGRKANRDDG